MEGERQQPGQAIAAMLALDEEVRTGSGLIRLGLAAVQATGPGNDFYHLPMLLLCQGFERLGKVVMILRRREVPGIGGSKGHYGHDLRRIVEDVVAHCFSDSYRARRVAEDDFQFLTSDPGLLAILDVLHTFANGARYWDLDKAEGSSTRSCQVLWAEMRDSLVANDPYIQRLLMTAEGASEGYHAMNQKVVTLLERFARAQSRLFMLGPLGDVGHSLGPPLHLFYSISDDRLGTRDYRAEPWVPAATM